MHFEIILCLGLKNEIHLCHLIAGGAVFGQFGGHIRRWQNNPSSSSCWRTWTNETSRNSPFQTRFPIFHFIFRNIFDRTWLLRKKLYSKINRATNFAKSVIFAKFEFVKINKIMIFFYRLLCENISRFELFNWTMKSSNFLHLLCK